MAHGDRSVDVFVRKLRAKLQKLSPRWDYIHTHFGIGYRFEPLLADASQLPPDSFEDEIQVAERPEPQRVSSSL
jgi:hypothetical protein